MSLALPCYRLLLFICKQICMYVCLWKCPRWMTLVYRRKRNPTTLLSLNTHNFHQHTREEALIKCPYFFSFDEWRCTNDSFATVMVNDDDNATQPNRLNRTAWLDWRLTAAFSSVVEFVSCHGSLDCVFATAFLPSWMESEWVFILYLVGFFLHFVCAFAPRFLSSVGFTVVSCCYCCLRDIT